MQIKDPFHPLNQKRRRHRPAGASSMTHTLGKGSTHNESSQAAEKNDCEFQKGILNRCHYPAKVRDQNQSLSERAIMESRNGPTDEAKIRRTFITIVVGKAKTLMELAD